MATSYQAESDMNGPFGASLNERMLTVSEAARLLNAHPNSVRRWADNHLLPVWRIGSRGDRRFKPQDIFTLLESWRLR